MNLKRRSVGWASTLLGGAALGIAIVRQRRGSGSSGLLKGKVVLVTGGSRGLGYAIAQRVAFLGGRLVLVSRHSEELQRAKDHLVAEYAIAARDVMIQPCDVSIPEEIQEVVTAATLYFGQIDVVVNNVPESSLLAQWRARPWVASRRR